MLDLIELNKQIDDALKKETTKSLMKWLKKKRLKQKNDRKRQDTRIVKKITKKDR